MWNSVHNISFFRSFGCAFDFPYCYHSTIWWVQLNIVATKMIAGKLFRWNTMKQISAEKAEDWEKLSECKKKTSVKTFSHEFVISSFFLPSCIYTESFCVSVFRVVENVSVMQTQILQLTAIELHFTWDGVFFLSFFFCKSCIIYEITSRCKWMVFFSGVWFQLLRCEAKSNTKWRSEN